MTAKNLRLAIMAMCSFLSLLWLATMIIVFDTVSSRILCLVCAILVWNLHWYLLYKIKD